MSFQAKELGIELFSGRLSHGAEARTAKIRALMARILGPSGPKPEPTDKRTSAVNRFFRLRMTAKHRTQAIEAATKLVRAFVDRKFEAIEPFAHEHLFALWPGGEMHRHRRGALIEALKARRGDRVPAEPAKIKAYPTSELALVLPRGVTEAIAAYFDAPGGILVTMEIDDHRGTSLTLAIMTSPDAKEVWRAHNLPFPNVDDAVRASTPQLAGDEEALVVADRIARHFVLGHARSLRSLRNQMIDHLFVDSELVEAEALSARADEDMHAADRLDRVFLGTSTGEMTPAIRALLRKRATEAWRRPFEKLKLKVAVTRIGDLDPETGDVERAPSKEVTSILLGVRDRDRLRWRLGGIFVADG